VNTGELFKEPKGSLGAVLGAQIARAFVGLSKQDLTMLGSNLLIFDLTITLRLR
jgi:hypothetical protein